MVILHYLTIILNFSLLRFAKSSKILIDKYNNEEEGYSAPLSIGSSLSSQLLQFNLMNNFTWISDYLVPNLTQCTKHSDVILKGLEPSILTDLFLCNFKVYLESISLKNFSIFVRKEENETKFIPFSYGLGSRFDDYSFSFVHKLKEENKISNLIFGFAPLRETSYNQGHIIFGGIPDEFAKRRKRSCQIDQKLIGWSCFLSKINVNGTFMVFNDYAYFNPSVEGIRVPFTFAQFFGAHLFMKELENGKCLMVWKDFFIFRCVIAVFEKISDKDIDFYIGDHKFRVPVRDLFSCNKAFCYSFIQTNKDPMNSQWIFGTSFFNLFASFFDYESKTISFYGELEEEKESLGNIRKYLIMINIFILSMMNIVFLTLKIIENRAINV